MDAAGRESDELAVRPRPGRLPDTAAMPALVVDIDRLTMFPGRMYFDPQIVSAAASSLQAATGTYMFGHTLRRDRQKPPAPPAAVLLPAPTPLPSPTAAPERLVDGWASDALVMAAVVVLAYGLYSRDEGQLAAAAVMAIALAGTSLILQPK